MQNNVDAEKDVVSKSLLILRRRCLSALKYVVAIPWMYKILLQRDHKIAVHRRGGGIFIICEREKRILIHRGALMVVNEKRRASIL